MRLGPWRSTGLTSPIVQMEKLRLKDALRTLRSLLPCDPVQFWTLGTGEQSHQHTTRTGCRNENWGWPGGWGPSHVLGSVPTPQAGPSNYLKWEPLISYNGRLGPIDNLGEGQLPARAEKYRDAASLGGGGVTGEPSPALHTLTHLPVPRQQLLLLGAKEQRGETSV